MEDDLKDWTSMQKQDKTLPKLDPVIIPALMIIIVALAVIVVQQYKIIGQYKESVEILAQSRDFMVDQYDDLYRGSVMARELLDVIDQEYIETIPSGVELRVRLAIEALYEGVEE